MNASLLKNIADAYDEKSNEGCKSGAIVTFSDKLFLCKNDTSGPFNPENFQQVYLSDLLRGHLNSNLGGVSKVSRVYQSNLSTTLTIDSDVKYIICTPRRLPSITIQSPWVTDISFDDYSTYYLKKVGDSIVVQNEEVSYGEEKITWISKTSVKIERTTTDGIYSLIFMK